MFISTPSKKQLSKSIYKGRNPQGQGRGNHSTQMLRNFGKMRKTETGDSNRK